MDDSDYGISGSRCRYLPVMRTFRSEYRYPQTFSGTAVRIDAFIAGKRRCFAEIVGLRTGRQGTWPVTSAIRRGIRCMAIRDLEFYPEAVDGFEAQKEALKQAKKFIFMEYHAIEDAQSFAGMKSILFEKAKEGVEVRLIYDDVGSMGFINTDFVKQMESHGIQCRIFNKIVPFVNIFMNNRDHRKITVIDGQVGFTGGYNLADEYFNITHPYGLWKDSGVRMEGDAVQSLTVMFLEMWNAIKKTDTDYAPYFPEITYTAKQTGYVQPYADNPLDDEHTGENVYMNILNSAQECH